MTNEHLFTAFFENCPQAQTASQVYVSLYVTRPYYGGPEEGGWWGEDVSLCAFQKCSSIEQAEALKARAEKQAEEMNKDAKRSYSEQCLRECEWLDNRGLDADFLPEVDGEEHYFIVIENEPGSQEREGCRHYE